MRFVRAPLAFYLLLSAAAGLVVMLAATAYSSATPSLECAHRCYEVAQPTPLPPALEDGKLLSIHGFRLRVPKHAKAIGVLNDSMFIRYDTDTVVAVTLDTLESASIQLEYLRDGEFTLADWAEALYKGTPEDNSLYTGVPDDAYRSIMNSKSTYFGDGRVTRYDGEEELSFFRVSGNSTLPHEEEVTVVDGARPNQLLYVSSTGLDTDIFAGIIGSIKKD